MLPGALPAVLHLERYSVSYIQLYTLNIAPYLECSSAYKRKALQAPVSSGIVAVLCSKFFYSQFFCSKFFYYKLFCPKLFCPKLFCPKLFVLFQNYLLCLTLTAIFLLPLRIHCDPFIQSQRLVIGIFAEAVDHIARDGAFGAFCGNGFRMPYNLLELL